MKTQEKLALKAENIDQVSALFFNTCMELKMDRKEAVKQRLALENALMEWSRDFGEDCEFEYLYYTRFFAPHFQIRCVNDRAVNPFRLNTEDFYSASILSILTNAPEYFYNNGTNHILFKPKKSRLNPMIELALVILVSLIIGITGLTVLPQNLISVLLSYVVEPLYLKFLDILSCIAGPLIFFSVSWGIYGIGDVATFNRLGKGLMLFNVVYTLVITALQLFTIPLFRFSLSGQGGGEFQILQILQMFLDMFPSTIIEPFATGNTLQIIVLAIVVGIAMLYLGKRSRSVANAIDQLNNIVAFILSVISKLVPAFIALVIINLIWSGGMKIISHAWKFIVVDIPAILICSFAFFMLTALRLKVKPSVLFKKLLPATIIALTTCSTAASYTELVVSCKKMGVDRSLSGFGIPLGIVTMKGAVGISLVLIAFYVASISNVTVSLPWFIFAVLISALMSIASPPVPGAGTIAFTMIFTQLNLPTEALGVMLAISMITEFVETASIVFTIPMGLAQVAGNYGLLDTNTLASDM